MENRKTGEENLSRNEVVKMEMTRNKLLRIKSRK